MNNVATLQAPRLRSSKQSRWWRGLLMAVVAVWGGAALAGPEGDQVPERFVLRLPEGETMAFRAIYLGIDGSRLFASRRVKLGSREASPSYKERQVETLLSGGFVGGREGKADWLYYLGETEVTEGQWNSVMQWWDQHDKRSTRPEVQSRLPKTAVTEAEVATFLEALNTWMLTERRGEIPRWRGALAFARLPTEAEWVFAARGGLPTISSDRDTFDRPYPYEDLSAYEWYRENSGKRAHEVGTKQPSPTGLYDMLGNVEELTINLFGPEYQHGRFGGLVICGGNFTVGGSDLSAALRTEALSHGIDGQPARQSKVGLRLALTTRITSARVLPQDLDAAMDLYLSDRGLTRPGPVGQSSPASQSAQDETQYLQDRIAILVQDLERCSSAAAVSAGQSARVADLEGRTRKLEQDRARLQADLKAVRASTDKAQAAAAAAEQSARVADLEQRTRDLEEERTGLQADLTAARASAEMARSALADKDAERSRRELDGSDRRCSQDLGRCRTERTDAAEREASARQERDQLDRERRRLADRVAELEARTSNTTTGLVRGADAYQELLLEIERKDQQIGDLKRRQQSFQYEIDKNSGRVRAVEKRYLEALMRQATANVLLGYQRLEQWSHALTDAERRDPVFRKRLFDAGRDDVASYLVLVETIADDTAADLFPEVKAALADWLKTRGRSQQRKALDLLDRQVREARAGRTLRLDDLVKSLPSAPEMH